MRDVIIIGELEIWPEDLGKMTWQQATETAQSLGPGWRLPTIREFEDVLYPNMKKIPKISTAYYWSSTEFDIYYAWYFGFTNGDANYYYNKSFTYYVRAVRDFTSDVAIEYLLKDF